MTRIRTREQALAAANATTRNDPGTCQKTTRGWFNAPSAGDQDKDGDADAVDGWVSEPTSARRPGDRNPPVGVPVAFSGGSKGFGHRALTRGPNGLLRSTDMRDGRYASGLTGNASIEQVERSMGVQYLGWSETIDGYPIPFDAGTHGMAGGRQTKVARAHRLVERALIRAEAKGQTKRAASLRKALRFLPEF